MRLLQHYMLAAVVMLLFVRRPHVGALLLPTQKTHEIIFCPILEDYCRCTVNYQEFVCKAAGFIALPGELPEFVLKLDLTSNNLTELHDKSLNRFLQLEELVLADNKLKRITPNAFSKNILLKRLDLQNCGLLDIPTNTLRPLMQLQSLNLGNNIITDISRDAFPPLNNLTLLLLKKNRIWKVHEDAFSDLTSLQSLELDDNALTEIPIALTRLSSLQKLSISRNRIKYIPSGLLQRTPSLVLLELKGNPLISVDSHAFSSLPHLRNLILSDARDLSTFPSLNGTTALEILRLDRAGIMFVPSTLCYTCPKLKSLDLKSNKLTLIPELYNCKDMRVL